jgi:hypothetical protein
VRATGKYAARHNFVNAVQQQKDIVDYASEHLCMNVFDRKRTI